MKKTRAAMTIKATICLIPFLVISSSQAASLTIQPYNYFSTASGFSDGDISVFDGKARWSGVTDSTGSTTHSGVFGDGTVLDYRFVGTTRNVGMTEHANGGGSYIGPLTVGTYGQSGGANAGLDVWTTTDPDNTGTWDTTPDSSSWGNDHVTGGDQINGTIDVSGLSAAQIYFVYGSYKNAATVTLTDSGSNPLGTLSLPSDGPDSDRLVIQEVTIDNDDLSYGTINFSYTAQANAGRGRFSGVIIDGTPIPEPASLALFGLASLMLLKRRHG